MCPRGAVFKVKDTDGKVWEHRNPACVSGGAA